MQVADRPQEFVGSEQLAVAEPAEAQLRVADGQPCVETVDGDVLPSAEARRVCKRNKPRALCFLCV